MSSMWKEKRMEKESEWGQAENWVSQIEDGSWAPDERSYYFDAIAIIPQTFHNQEPSQFRGTQLMLQQPSQNMKTTDNHKLERPESAKEATGTAGVRIEQQQTQNSNVPEVEVPQTMTQEPPTTLV
jgi:hypothetical protein